MIILEFSLKPVVRLYSLSHLKNYWELWCQTTLLGINILEIINARCLESSQPKSIICTRQPMLILIQSRKIIAGNIIISTMAYVIQVYGGCSDYLLAALQVLQNRAARFITRLPLTSALLKQCGWQSIKQLLNITAWSYSLRLKLTEDPLIYTRGLISVSTL